MADSSFDIVSKIDRQEVDNALNQAAREIAAALRLQGHRRRDQVVRGRGDRDHRERRRAGQAVLDVFKEKLVKRSQSLKILDAGEPRQSGKDTKISVALKEGITPGAGQEGRQADPRRGPEGRQGPGAGRRAARVQQEARRPAGRIALVKAQDYDFAVQFTNYR